VGGEVSLEDGFESESDDEEEEDDDDDDDAARLFRFLVRLLVICRLLSFVGIWEAMGWDRIFGRIDCLISWIT
jgi:hypothetical protein